MKKLNSILMNNWSFPLLTALLGAALLGGTHLYITEGFGIFSEIAQAQMIHQGMETGDFAAPIGYCTGFLLARILEGPLVGIMDIGGSMMTGVGTGISSLILSISGIRWIMYNGAAAMIAGAVVGAVIGFIVIGVKKTMPEGMAAAGTNVMMGAGNATGRYLGPLIILSAANYSIPAGIGAIIGAAIFHKIDKGIVGGTILGALLFAVLFPVAG